MLIEGPSGIGKTRLLAELAECARERGLLVSGADCDELDQYAPMTPLLTALRAGTDPILPSRELDSAATDADRRFWFLERMRNVLEQRSRRTPLVIILDDLQWADTATLTTLSSLCPRLDSAAVLWAFAYRSGHLPRDLHRVLDRLRTGETGQLSLSALNRDDTRELASDLLGRRPSATACALIEEAHGNPLLITQLLTSAVDENLLVDPATTTAVAVVPRRFADDILRRLGEVSPDVRQLLEVGAVLGRSFTLDDAARMLARPTGQLIQTLAMALDTGLLITEQDRVVFGHSLIHQAIYEDLLGAVRVGLHREAARLLLETGGSACEAAEHLLATAPTGDTRAISTLMTAIDEMSQRSPKAAADLAARTLHLVGPDNVRQPRLLATAVELLTRARRITDARDLAERALSRKLPPDVEATIRLALATGLNFIGDAPAALAEAAAASVLPNLTSRLLADLRAAEGTARLQARDLAGAEQCAAESLRLGHGQGTASATVSGMILTSQVAYYRGRVTEALSTARTAVRVLVGEPAAKERLPRLWLARVLLAGDRPAEAEEICREGEGVSTEIGAVWSRPYWWLCRARCHLECGQIADAARDAEAARTIAEELGLARPVAEALGVLGQVAFHQGDLTRAEDLVQRAEVATGDLTPDPGTAWVKAQLADALGNPDKALEIACQDDGSPGQDRLASLLEICVSAIPDMARIALRAGRPDDCRILMTQAQGMAETNPALATTTGIAAHLEGIVHRDPEALGRAVFAYQEAGRRLAAAMAGEDLGRALLQAGDRTAAVMHLRTALETATEIGALRYVDRIRRVLRDAGVPHRFISARRQVTFGLGSLTDAELRVASLAVEGLTNQAIADRLFLSPHTINTHLRHVFNKLGVSSRVELTRVVLTEMPAAAACDGRSGS